MSSCCRTDAWCARSQEMHLLLGLGPQVLPGGPGSGAHTGSHHNNANIWEKWAGMQISNEMNGAQTQRCLIQDPFLVSDGSSTLCGYGFNREYIGSLLIRPRAGWMQSFKQCHQLSLSLPLPSELFGSGQLAQVVSSSSPWHTVLWSESHWNDWALTLLLVARG